MPRACGGPPARSPRAGAPRPGRARPGRDLERGRRPVAAGRAAGEPAGERGDHPGAGRVACADADGVRALRAGAAARAAGQGEGQAGEGARQGQGQGRGMTGFAEGVPLDDGRYTLERRLGAGGMAAGWLARDERLGRPVAIKVLSDLLASDPGYVQRFRREARVAAGLSHPGLVRIFDFGDDPRPYLVMEYVAGGTLAERLRDGGADELDCE